MNRRKVAQIILALRRVALAKIVADAKGESTTELGAEFVALARLLPWSVQAGGGLETRVTLPAYRKIRREGILAQTNGKPFRL